MNFFIAPATTHDIDPIYRLIRSERKYLLYRSKKNILEHIQNFLVIKNNDAIIGCASFENYSPEIAEVRSMVILPRFRGRGLARKLMRALLKRKGKKQKVFIVTSKVAYFEHLGFRNALHEKYVLFKR